MQHNIANVEFPQHWIVPLGGRHADEVAVSNWLSGRNEPTLRNLLRLSEGSHERAFG